MFNKQAEKINDFYQFVIIRSQEKVETTAIKEWPRKLFLLIIDFFVSKL